MRHELVRRRKQLKLTQMQMATKLGISRSFYGMIELGTREPDIPLMKAISELLDADVATLFFGDECHGKGHNEQAATSELSA